MDAERLRAFALTLPHVAETVQWGDNLVFWVGEKTAGGRMFCLVPLDAGGKAVASFAATPEHYAELLERNGLIPAPYMARIFWVAAERWSALSTAEWTTEVRAAHDRVWGRLAASTRKRLASPGETSSHGEKRQDVPATLVLPAKRPAIKGSARTSAKRPKSS